VGSSRKSSSFGRAASSTPMVKRLRSADDQLSRAQGQMVLTLNVQPRARDTNNSIGVRLHVEQADDVVDIGQSLLALILPRLAK
jgi:hypothetical protein